MLRVNQQVRVAVRAGELESIVSATQTGKRRGMILLGDDLHRLVGLGKISVETHGAADVIEFRRGAASQPHLSSRA